MTMSTRECDELLKRALALPAEERAALANTLFESLEDVGGDAEGAWRAEVERRMADLKAGRAVTVPWEELHRQLLAMMNER